MNLSKGQEKKRSAEGQPSPPDLRLQRTGPSGARKRATGNARPVEGGQAGTATPVEDGAGPLSLHELDHVSGRMRPAVSSGLRVNSQVDISLLPGQPSALTIDPQLEADCRRVIQNEQRLRSGDTRQANPCPATQIELASRPLGTVMKPFSTQLTRKVDPSVGRQAAATALLPSRGRSGQTSTRPGQPAYPVASAQYPPGPSNAINTQQLVAPSAASTPLDGVPVPRAGSGVNPTRSRNPPKRTGTGAGTSSQKPSRHRSRKNRRSVRQGSSSEASDATGPGPRPFAEDSAFLRSANRHLMVSIETSFFLRPRDHQMQRATVEDFMDGLVARYNASHAAPKLTWSDQERFIDSNWHILSVPMKGPPAFPQHFRMTSPLFEVRHQSRWREAVTTLWTYLLGSCLVSETQTAACDTHISVNAKPDFELGESNLIAQAALYFETAIDALLPQRNGNNRAKSNWVHATRFAPSHRSRLESMDFVQPNPYLFVFGALMASNYPSDNNFAWNFQEFGDDWESIQFRKPGFSRGPEYGLSWAEFTMAFLLAAMQDPDRNMRLIPPTVAGLKWFLARHNPAGLTQSPLMRRVWDNVPSGAMLTPKICLDEGVLEEDIPDEMEVMQSMIQEDKDWRESQVQALRDRPPYY